MFRNSGVVQVCQRQAGEAQSGQTYTPGTHLYLYYCNATTFVVCVLLLLFM